MNSANIQTLIATADGGKQGPSSPDLSLGAPGWPPEPWKLPWGPSSGFQPRGLFPSAWNTTQVESYSMSFTQQWCSRCVRTGMEKAGPLLHKGQTLCASRAFGAQRPTCRQMPWTGVAAGHRSRRTLPSCGPCLSLAETPSAVSCGVIHHVSQGRFRNSGSDQDRGTLAFMVVSSLRWLLVLLTLR